MLRQALRRCGRLSSSVSSTSVLLQPRWAIQAGRRAKASVFSEALMMRAQSGASPYRLRGYSTEASAVREVDAEADNSATKFEELLDRGVHPNLISAITKGMGFETMSSVQAKTINPALKGTDIVAQAKTGTGKTIAFLLPLLQRMIDDDPKLATKSSSRYARSDDIRGIIMSPTRELAEQIATEARKLVAFTGVVVQTAVGGTSRWRGLRNLQGQGCHLLVATPGRLLDLLQDPSTGVAAPNLAALVLDEADRMLDVGFEKQLHDIIECLPSPSEKVRQTILVSATIPDEVIRLARNMVRPQNFEFVQTIASDDTLTHDHVPQHMEVVRSWADIFPALLELLDREARKRSRNPSMPPFKALVYFNTTAMVEYAGELNFRRKTMKLASIPCFKIHSKNSQIQRDKSTTAFRALPSAVLFSSDVTARGMDFPNVTHVIQVGCPKERETYVHRVGRTGRQEKEGQAWMLIPFADISLTKRLLHGLPLKEVESLADKEAQDDRIADYKDQIRRISQTMNSQTLTQAYTSLLGSITIDKEASVKGLNDMAVDVWGMKAPPAVPSVLAQKMGLINTPLNLSSDRDRRSFEGRAPYRQASSRRETDPFKAIERRVRRF